MSDLVKRARAAAIHKDTLYWELADELERLQRLRFAEPAPDISDTDPTWVDPPCMHTEGADEPPMPTEYQAAYRVAEPAAPVDVRAAYKAWSDWAWRKEGEPVGRQDGQTASHEGFIAGAQWQARAAAPVFKWPDFMDPKQGPVLEPAAHGDEREAFMAWFMGEPSVVAFERERMWLSWQARAATPAVSQEQKS